MQTKKQTTYFVANLFELNEGELCQSEYNGNYEYVHRKSFFKKFKNLKNAQNYYDNNCGKLSVIQGYREHLILGKIIDDIIVPHKSIDFFYEIFEKKLFEEIEKIDLDSKFVELPLIACWSALYCNQGYMELVKIRESKFVTYADLIVSDKNVKYIPINSTDNLYLGKKKSFK